MLAKNGLKSAMEAIPESFGPAFVLYALLRGGEWVFTYLKHKHQSNRLDKDQEAKIREAGAKQRREDKDHVDARWQKICDDRDRYWNGVIQDRDKHWQDVIARIRLDADDRNDNASGVVQELRNEIRVMTAEMEEVRKAAEADKIAAIRCHAEHEATKKQLDVLSRMLEQTRSDIEVLKQQVRHG